jgi:enamine deaminase RidA (YjgF/YER057c/UK114 family)
MPEFKNPYKSFPICDAVIYSGKIMETVITPIPDGQSTPVSGTAREHMIEILRQLDEVLALCKTSKANVVSVRLYLQDVNRDIALVNEVYKAYFAGCSPMRIAVGVQLQAGMLVEGVFLAEVPS